MPLTLEQKRRLIQSHGLNPDEYDVDASEENIIPLPPKSLQPSGDVTTTVNLPKTPTPAPSMLDTARRGATQSLLPTAAGLAATAGTLALLPEPFISKIGAAGAGLAAILAGTGASIGASKLQEKVVPDEVQKNLFLRPEDIEQNKYTSILSGLAPSLLAFKPNLSDVGELIGGVQALPKVATAGSSALTQNQLNALINAGANVLPSAGMYGYDVATGQRKFDIGSAIAETLPGALLTRPTRVGEALGFHSPTEAPSKPKTITEKTAVPDISTLPPEELLRGIVKQFGIVPDPTEVVPKGKAPKSGVEVPFKSAKESAGVFEQQGYNPELLTASEAETQKIAKAREEESIRAKKLREAAFTQAEAEAEIQVQRAEATRIEAERLKKENEQRKIDIAIGGRKGFGEEIPMGERLTTKIENNRLSQPEQIPVVNKGVELNKIKQQNKVQKELEAPLTEGERIQDEYDRGIRNQESSDLPPLDSTPIESLPSNTKNKIKNEILRVARLRNQRVKYVNSLKNPKTGKEVLGQFNPDTNEMLLNKQLFIGTTGPHETSHGRVIDFLNSGDKRDNDLVLRGLEFADERNRKFKSPEDFKKLPIEEQLAIEERFVSTLGQEGYRRIRTDLFGKRRERFGEWVDQVKNHFKTKFNIASPEELRGHFIERQMYDAPDSTRVGGGMKIEGTGGKDIEGEKRNQEENDLPPSNKALETLRETYEEKIKPFVDAVDTENWKSVPEAFRKEMQKEFKSTLGSITYQILTERPSSFSYTPYEVNNKSFRNINDALKEAQGDYNKISYTDEAMFGYEKVVDNVFKVFEASGKTRKEIEVLSPFVKALRKAEDLSDPILTKKETIIRNQESPDLPDKKDAGDFFTVSSKILKSKNMIGLDYEKQHPVEQLKGTLFNKIPPIEQELLKNSGIDKLKGKMSPRELENWIKENGPKVKVLDYGMEGKVSEAKKEYDRMTHEWFDTLPSKARRLIQDYNYHGTSELYETLKEYYPNLDLNKLKKYEELANKVSSEPQDTSPRATGYYSSISALPTDSPMPEWTKSKLEGNVQRVDVVIPLKGDNDVNWKQRNESVKWQPDNLHENVPNTLGWAMLQYKTGPKGEKIAVIAEAQSRWGQAMRERRQELANTPASESNSRALQESRLTQDHPLLRDYNRLILKAAIAQAKKEGATHIMISDGETAMMTEQHDVGAQDIANAHVGGREPEISQEKGMRLNYDKVLPSIAEDLLGSKGERVSLGEHKNAFTRSRQPYDIGYDPLLDTDKKQRENLTFKNPDGTPKTDVSGLLYPIDKAAGDYSLTAKRFQESPDLPSSEVSDEPASLPRRIFSSTTQSVRNLGGKTADHVASQSEKFFDKKSLYEGKYSNTIQAEITSYPKEVRDRVDQYGREMMAEGKSDIVIEDNSPEASLRDSLRQYLINVADDNTARLIKKDPNYWPAILNTEVVAKWAKAPNSPEGKYYQNEWMRHAQKQVDKGKASYTREELKGILSDYMSALKSGGREHSLTFGALRKAQGLGLPISMQDNNLLSRFGRYGNRVAKDMAFRETIESDPTMRYMFRIKDDKGQTLTEPPNLPSGEVADSNIRDAEPLQNVQKFMYEEFSNNQHPRIQAISRVINSALLGTATGVRDLVTSPLNLLPVIGARNAKAMVEGLKDLTTSARESFEYGARKIKMNELEFGSAAHPDTLTGWFNEVADGLRKYSGREALEQGSRVYMYGVGKVAALAEFGRAANGNETSIKWLKKYGHTVDNIGDYIGKTGADIPEDVINRIAKTVTDRAAGTYDARGLPTVVMEGPLSPFFSLSRWSIEKANTIVEDVLIPARKGDYTPLISYTLGSLLTGAAIQQLNLAMSSGKKGSEPTLTEAQAANEQQVRAFVNLLQLGSYGGLIGDLMKSSVEAYSGHLPRGLSFPLADFVSETLGKNLADYTGAIQAGENKVEASMGLIEKILTDSVQSVKLLSYATWNKDDVERKNAYRDYRLWQELSGRKSPDSTIQRPNEFLNKNEKEFKRAKTPEDIEVTFPKAIESVIEKAGGNPLELIDGFKRLKANSYQTWPTEPVEQVAYYEYLKTTVGEEKAAQSFMDFMQQRELNKVKNRMIPNLTGKSGD